MKYLISFDKYKSTFTQEEVSSFVSDVLRKQGIPEEDLIICPLSDGGEGSLLALEGSDPSLQRKELGVTGPLLLKTKAFYLVDPVQKKACIELASASGLALVPEEKRNPLFTSTYGTGELIKEALENGYRDISLFLGGSSTSDGGTGILEALSFRFYDEKGRALHYLTGKDLGKIERIEVPGDSKDARFTLYTDVRNPLLGKDGAARTFAPQKGASAEDVETLEKGSEHYVRVLKEMTGKDFSKREGSGAAGGAGFSLSYFFPCTYESGSRFLFQKLGLQEKIRKSDVLLSGEGRLDSTSFEGKALSAFLPYAFVKRVVFLPGSAELAALKEAQKKGIEVYPLFEEIPEGLSKEKWVGESKKRMEELLIREVLRSK